jgi:hypothetical protein
MARVRPDSGVADGLGLEMLIVILGMVAAEDGMKGWDGDTGETPETT